MRTITLFTTLILLLTLVGVAHAATYYVDDDAGAGGDGSSGNPFQHIQQGVAILQAGDTLIIRDGTYYGSSTAQPILNTLTAGTAANPITIRAENDYGVIIDGTNLNSGYNNVEIDQPYYVLQGIISQNSPLTGILIKDTHHVKVQRCAGIDPHEHAHAIGISNSDYSLIEDSFALGHARYQMGISSTPSSSFNIFRHNVARFDYSESDEPKASFSAYAQSNNFFFNNIAIDGQARIYTGQSDCTYVTPSAFMTPNGFQNVEFRGNIALNFEGNGFLLEGSNAQDAVVEDNVVWDVRPGHEMAAANCNGSIMYISSDLLGGSGWVIDHNTFGDKTKGAGLEAKTFSNPTVTAKDNIFNNLQLRSGRAAVSSDFGSDYNVFYDNSQNYGPSPGTHDWSSQNANAINPLTNGLKYLTKIEDGSALDGAASDGGDRGATILYQIGATGTLYGEAGWNTVQTDTPLWPWKDEDVIKQVMCGYSNPIHPEIVGNRGFCVYGDGSLTDYIWSYLGNTDHPYHTGYTPACPNGVTDSITGEECDDGNSNNGDGCSSTCQNECGDGNVDTNGADGYSEECDGALIPDTCTSYLGTGWTGTMSCYAEGNANECEYDTSGCSYNAGCSITDAYWAQGSVGGPVSLSYDDSGQWTYHEDSASNGNTLYVTTTHGIQSWDVTNPTNPLMLDDYYLGSATPFKIDYYNNLVAVTSEQGDLFIFSVNNPSQMQLLGSQSNLGTRADVGFYHSGSTYVLSAGEGSIDFKIFSLANPSNPSLVGQLALSGVGMGVTTAGDHAYVLTNQHGVYSIDLSNPSSPSIDYDLVISSSVQRMIASDGNTLAVAGNSNGVYLIDITTPTALSVLTNFMPVYDAPNTGLRVEGVDVVGDTLYILSEDQSTDGADWATGIAIYDITNRASPVKIVSETTLDWLAFDDLQVSNNRAYAAHWSGSKPGVVIYDVTGNVITHRSTTAGYDYCRDVAKSGDIVACATGHQGVFFHDHSQNGQLVEQGQFLPQLGANSGTWGVDLQGNYAYMVSVIGSGAVDQGFVILDISNPANPMKVSEVDVDSARTVKVDGDVAYVGSLSLGLVAIDISDKNDPVILDSVRHGSRTPFGIDIRGTRAITAEHNEEMNIWDISNPSNIQLLGTFPISPGSDYRSMDADFIDDDTALLIIGSGDPPQYIHLIDISNPASPTEITRLFDGSQMCQYDCVNPMDVIGDYLFLCQFGDGIEVYDISTPTNPQLLDTYNTPGACLSTIIEGNYAYIADRSGLIALDFDGAELTELSDLTTVNEGEELTLFAQSNCVDGTTVTFNLAEVDCAGSCDYSDIDVSDTALLSVNQVSGQVSAGQALATWTVEWHTDGGDADTDPEYLFRADAGSTFDSNRIKVMGTGNCVDQDGDGYGYPASPDCYYPEEDCDDVPAYCGPMCNPGIPFESGDYCHDGYDNDCDGLVDNDDECSVEDVNNDLIVNLNDFLLAASDLHYAPGENSGSYTDVNGDGKVTLLDLVLIARQIA